MITTLTNLFATFGFAGGGGSFSGGGGGGFGGGGGGYVGGSDGSGSSNFFTYFIFIGLAVVLAAIIIVNSRKGSKARQAQREMQQRISELAATDPSWNLDQFTTLAKDLYPIYQLDWENYNLESMRRYMSDSYFERNQLMVLALQQISRRNAIRNITIVTARVVGAHDRPSTDSDSFGVEMGVMARDILIDTRTGKQLYAQDASVVETYNFVRSGTNWLLDSIDEGTASAAMRDIKIETFANQHRLYYSLDWGRLLLPTEGYLFGGSTFEYADINNHCIGVYRNLLVQIYSYSPSPRSNVSKNHVIAQIALPKSYGRIVVRHRAGVQLPISGLTRIKTEWSDFNKKYDVYASDQEKATSFELLNPGFMQRLESYDADINIEVVDNIVYLYTPQNKANEANYQTMFSVLEESFKELRI